jgi:hypothetical protein
MMAASSKINTRRFGRGHKTTLPDPLNRRKVRQVVLLLTTRRGNYWYGIGKER